MRRYILPPFLLIPKSRQLIIVLLDLFIFIAMAEILYHESFDHSRENRLQSDWLFISMKNVGAVGQNFKVCPLFSSNKRRSSAPSLNRPVTRAKAFSGDYLRDFLRFPSFWGQVFGDRRQLKLS
jgi:hypothetical protein